MVDAIVLVALWICIFANLTLSIMNIQRFRQVRKKYKEAGETCLKALELYKDALKHLSDAKEHCAEAEKLRDKAKRHLSEVEVIHREAQVQNN